MRSTFMILTKSTLRPQPSSKDINAHSLAIGVSHYAESTAMTMWTLSFSTPLVEQNCAAQNTLCPQQRLSATTSRHPWNENTIPSSMSTSSQSSNNLFGIYMQQKVSLPKLLGLQPFDAVTTTPGRS
jgi:hypothetical protein